MKNRYTLLAASLSLFLLAGTLQAQEKVTGPLGEFERSLTKWMRSMETIVSRIDALEKKVSETKGVSPELTRSLTEIADSVGSVRNDLSRFNSRLGRIEDSLGGAAGENPMVEFGRTLNTLKKNLAELTKRVQDTEVVSAVLENKYADYMRPLDPIKRTLEEHKETLDTLVQDTSTQKEKTGTLESVLTDRLAILDDFLTVSEKQMKSLDVIVQRVATLESNAGITPPEELYTEEEAVEVAEAAAEEAKPKTPEEEGFEKIGEGFYVRNVLFKPFGSSSRVTGELKNLSSIDYRYAIFNIMVYDLDNVLVSDHDFTVKGLKKDTVKPFKLTITGANPGNISRYAIRFKRTTQY
ncbi:MAG: FxLYD domain-containing protein [Candidatus Brocadiales bacterium]